VLTRYSTILGSLLVLFVLMAVENQFKLGGLLVVILLTVVALSGVFVASSRRRDIYIYISIALAVPWIALLWVHSQVQSSGVVTAVSVSGAVFLAFTIYLMLHHIFSAREVGNDLLAGAGRRPD
jgi:hypothetical protein